MVNAEAEKTLATNYWDKDKDKNKQKQSQRLRQEQRTKTKTNDECPSGADFRDQLLGQLDDEDKEDEEYEDDIE